MSRVAQPHLPEGAAADDAPCDRVTARPAGRRRVGWAVAAVLASLLTWFSTPARSADAYGDTCAGCHAVGFASTAPPQLLSQTGGVSNGKILPRPDDGRLADNCNPAGATAFYLCGLRQKMRGENASGGIVNPTARSNMLFYATSVTNADLEAVRQYLIQVRDAAVIPPSPAPTFAANVIGAASATTSTFSFRIANYRGVPLNYALGKTGSNAADFTLGAPSVSGAGCSSSGVPATTTRSARECTVTLTVGFRPTGGTAGARSAALHVTLSAPSTPNLDPDPNDTTADKSIALTANATAATPGFAISSTSLTLSSPVGSAVDSSAITITNPAGASANLLLGSLAAPFSGAASADYALVSAAASPCSTGGTTLAPGAGCNLVVRFLPTAKGPRNATLTIAHNAAGNPAVVALNGTGQQGALTLAGLLPSPFGSVNLGSSAQRTLAISNSGDAPLSFTAFALSGSASADYSVNSSGCASPLAAGASCTLTLTFAPSASGARSATLAVNSTASNAPTVALTGSGIGLADPTVSPASVAAFPTTDVGSTSGTTRVVTISNPRANPLGYAPAFGGANAADFAIGAESCATRSIAAGGTCTLTLRFTPATGPGAGSRIAALGLAFSGSGSDPSPASQSVALSGTASVPAPVFAISANPIGFVTTVGTPVDTSAVISNTGNAVLTLSAFSFGGSFASDYILAPANTCSAGTALAAAASCSLVVRFLPAAAGSRDATLSIAHNAAGSPQAISLSGSTSAAPQPAIDFGGTSALAFGSVALGSSSAPQTFNLRNSGAAALNIASIGVSGAAAGDYSRRGSCAAGSPLAAGASCSVSVSFSPAAAGTRSALLTIASDASNTPNRSVTLSGDGAALPEPLVTPQPLDPFPSTQPGSTSSASRVLSIVNPRANPIGYARSLSGANAGDFAVAAESCPARLIPAGSICTLSLQFTPLAAASGANRSATLALAFSGSGADPAPAAQSVALAGIAALAAPGFSVSAGTLNFTVAVGASAGAVAVITNTGSAALVLTALEFGGAFAADYSLAPGNTCTTALSLPPSGSCTLALRFTPLAAGSRDATFSVTHNAAGATQVLTLHGTATPAPQGRIELSVQRTLNFADTALNSASAQTITVLNSGDAALNFASLSIAGAAASEFERAGSCSVGVVLASNATCSVVVTFRPAALGARAASISLQSDASNGAATIGLVGNGVAAPAPQVTLSPATLAFGARTLGGIYPRRMLRLTNAGSADLQGIAIVVSGTGFADVSDVPCPARLPPGAGCDIQVSFVPSAAGASYGGSVRVASNAGGSPHTALLSGSGTNAAVPVLVWASTLNRLDFGAVSAGSVSPPQSVSVTNQGPGGAVLTLLNAVGPDAANFSVAAGTCTVGQLLFEGASCSLDVRFAPGSAGDKNATVQVASTGSLAQTLALSGTGLSGPNASLSVSASRLSFEATRVGAQSLPVEVTLTSDGSGGVRVTGMQSSGPYAVQAKSCPALPFTLPSGSACSVTVTFQPQAEGAASGLLRVDSDADPAQRQVALDGSAVAKADVASGGCSLAAGDTLADPTLWALAGLALAGLLHRRHVRRATRRAATRAVGSAPQPAAGDDESPGRRLR